MIFPAHFLVFLRKVEPPELLKEVQTLLGLLPDSETENKEKSMNAMICYRRSCYTTVYPRPPIPAPAQSIGSFYRRVLQRSQIHITTNRKGLM